MTTPVFPINEFEYHAYRRENELAARAMVKLLENVDAHYGVLMNIDEWAQSESARDIMDDHLLTRLASAITTLVTDPQFTISDYGVARLALFHRWLSALFSASPFRNADHVLRSLGTDPEAKNTLQLRNSEIRKFQLFYLTDSEVRLDWDVFWKFDKIRTANLAISILSTRLMASPSAHSKREMLLRWLPPRLPEIDWDDLPGGVIHDAYMHCSYADLPAKHDLKRAINVLIRRKLESLGMADVQRQAADPSTIELPADTEADILAKNPDKKPVVLVVLEWFSKNHSIYRTHSQTMVAMRDKFHLIGMGYDSRVDETGRAVFDEFIEISGNHLWEHAAHVRQVSESRQAQVAYMPSVGMFPITMVLACLRVAPLQLMALGHPATTHGHAMDYVVVEKDYVGDEACFSEKLLKLPKDGMPYRPPAAMTEMKLERGRLGKRGNPDTVRIAVAATIIKLNPGFLKMCGQIAREAQVPVEFHFLVGQANGITYPQLCHIVRRLVGKEAVTHKHQNYDRYMQVIADCDMFMNPFPFGNTNGIVDTVWAGLVGICKTGPEVHEHIDEGMFRRLGFPEWTIARTHGDYKAAALRMIHRHEERHQMAAALAGPPAIEKLIFKGRPEILGERIWALWRERVTGGRETVPAQDADQAKIYYLAYGKPNTGGDFVNIEHVNALNAMGFDATLAYLNEKTDPSTLACRAVHAHSVTFKPDDIVVSFENDRSVLEWVAKLACRKVLHNQNTFFLMRAVHTLDELTAWGFESVICPSRYGTQMMREAGYTGAVAQVSPAIPAYFERGQKTLSIAYSPRKRSTEVEYVRSTFRSKYPQYRDVPWVPIQGVPRAQVARIVGDAGIYASFAKLESICLSVLEAMRAGCIVVGDHGGSGLEYATAGNGLWLRENEYERFADALFHAVEIFKHSGSDNAFAMAAMKTASMYDEEHFNGMLGAYWDGMGVPRA